MVDDGNSQQPSGLVETAWRVDKEFDALHLAASEAQRAVSGIHLGQYATVAVVERILESDSGVGAANFLQAQARETLLARFSEEPFWPPRIPRLDLTASALAALYGRRLDRDPKQVAELAHSYQLLADTLTNPFEPVAIIEGQRLVVGHSLKGTMLDTVGRFDEDKPDITLAINRANLAICENTVITRVPSDRSAVLEFEPSREVIVGNKLGRTKELLSLGIDARLLGLIIAGNEAIDDFLKRIVAIELNGVTANLINWRDEDFLSQFKNSLALPLIHMLQVQSRDNPIKSDFALVREKVQSYAPYDVLAVQIDAVARIIICALGDEKYGLEQLEKTPSFLIGAWVDSDNFAKRVAIRAASRLRSRWNGHGGAEDCERAYVLMQQALTHKALLTI